MPKGPEWWHAVAQRVRSTVAVGGYYVVVTMVRALVTNASNNQSFPISFNAKRDTYHHVGTNRHHLSVDAKSTNDLVD